MQGGRCNRHWVEKGHSMDELISLMDRQVEIMSDFRDDRNAWEQAYATAFCKMSEFGATFANKVCYYFMHWVFPFCLKNVFLMHVRARKVWLVASQQVFCQPIYKQIQMF